MISRLARTLALAASVTSVALVALTTPLGAQELGTVSGRVADLAGTPLQGTSVSLVGTQRGALTRGDGTYRFSAPAGRYAIRARLLGYAPRTDSVTVRAGGTATVNFTLDHAAANLEAVTTLGSRGEERTVISAPVPIDVLPAGEVRATGRTETAQMIQALAPSFNFPRTTLGDATDNVRPATLRGLSPDQVLVLVNGKRRHLSGVVNINGFVGRGSEAVDLNAIPASMIDHVEILRDAAAAQYGSDAIAGVVNIVLKSSGPGDVSTEVGEYSTREPSAGNFGAAGVDAPTYHHDGKQFFANADHGFTIGQNGYVFLGGEIRDRGFTNRAAPDTRQQYFTNDPRNNDPSLPVPDRIDFRIGDSYNHDTQGFLNAGTTLSNGVQLYAFGGASRRFGDAFAFWRRPMDATNVRQIYPNGFLPEEQPTIWDGSGVAGAKGKALGWGYDLSTGYGRNAFHMDVVNSVNVSLGPTSPTRFDAGSLAFGQWTNTLDLTRDFALGTRAPLHAAWGGEFRVDQYQITAGGPASYQLGTFKVFDASGNQTSTLAAAGAQGYPGFTPEDAGNNSRNNVAAYVDLSNDLTRTLFVDLAARYEHYSDFGSTTTGKASARFEPVKGYALRGSVSSGFRAPSLGQEFFSSTTINFITLPGQTAAQPLEIRTFAPTSPQAAILNAKPLKPETSMNYSLGVALEPARALSVTVDAYRIDLNDRIVLSSNFTGNDVVAALQGAGFVGLGGARYFTNAVDTRTRGLDVVANYGWSLTPDALLRATVGYNGNWTRVTRVDTANVLGGHSDQLFNRVERARLEKGQPRDNLVFMGDLTVKRLGGTVRVQRFGPVTSFGTTTAGDQTWSPKVVTDLSLSYGPVMRVRATLGADNVFDTYPDATIAANSNSGILPFSGISPFGFNGRFLYVKLSAGI
jgi:iron complex outermembrane receptor protein